MKKWVNKGGTVLNGGSSIRTHVQRKMEAPRGRKASKPVPYKETAHKKFKKEGTRMRGEKGRSSHEG